MPVTLLLTYTPAPLAEASFPVIVPPLMSNVLPDALFSIEMPAPFVTFVVLLLIVPPVMSKSTAEPPINKTPQPLPEVVIWLFVILASSFMVKVPEPMLTPPPVGAVFSFISTVPPIFTVLSLPPFHAYIPPPCASDVLFDIVPLVTSTVALSVNMPPPPFESVFWVIRAVPLVDISVPVLSFSFSICRVALFCTYTPPPK